MQIQHFSIVIALDRVRTCISRAQQITGACEQDTPPSPHLDLRGSLV